MRGYYAIGALVLCIVLLYIVIRNVEPFANKTVKIYANIDNADNIKFLGSNDNLVKSASNTTKKISINFGTYKRIKKIVSISSLVAFNGKCTAIPNLKPGTCWNTITDVHTISVMNTITSLPKSANYDNNFNLDINPKNPIITFNNITSQKLNLVRTKGARSANIPEIGKSGNIIIEVIVE